MSSATNTNKSASTSPAKQTPSKRTKTKLVSRKGKKSEEPAARPVENPDGYGAETARLLGVSERTVDRYIRKDSLHSVRRGRSVLIEGQSIIQITLRTSQRASLEVLRL